MEQDDLLGADPRGKLEGMAIGAVAPTDAMYVFLVGVLGVMDQEIGAGRELVARGPLWLEPLALKAEHGLVVRQVGGDPAPLLDPIADGRVRMTDQRGPDAERTDFDGRPRHLVADDAGQVRR